MSKIRFQATVSGRKYGYVYVLSYPGSDKLKIGHSLDPFDRAEDIGGTKAPENPVVEASFWCSERREDVERAAHRLEQGTRHNGEWFAISVERAINVIRSAAEQVSVEIQLVYDRDECDKKAAAKLEAERQAINERDKKAAAKLEADRQALIKAEQLAAAEAQRLAEIEKVERDAEADRQAAIRKSVLKRQPRNFSPEQEAERLERVRVWKLNEAIRLQERYEKALSMPDTIGKLKPNGIVIDVASKVINE